MKIFKHKEIKLCKESEVMMLKLPSWITTHITPYSTVDNYNCIQVTNMFIFIIRSSIILYSKMAMLLSVWNQYMQRYLLNIYCIPVYYYTITISMYNLFFAYCIYVYRYILYIIPISEVNYSFYFLIKKEKNYTKKIIKCSKRIKIK